MNVDKKKAVKNITVSIIFKLILLVLALLPKRFLIKYVGNDANGLFALYQSIIGILSVAELGISTAISYSFYKPIINKEDNKVNAIYNLFAKAYRVIGLVILLSGILVMPFIKYLAKDYTIDVNIYLAYMIVLVATVITYLYNSKCTLVNAYKNNYIETTFQSVAMILQYIGQIVVLILTHNFYLYLLMIMISNFIHYLLISIYVNKKHKNVISDKEQKVDDETKKEIVKNVKAMFIHKLGSAIFNSIDSIIISAILGVVILGKYSNYTTIMNSMRALIILFFVPLTSIVGHVCVNETSEKKEEYFNFFYFFNLIIGVVFHLGFYAVIQDLIPIIFGENLNLDKGVIFVFSINYFVQFMRQCIYLFKDATGSFYYDRWVPLVEGFFNIVFSLLFGYYFGIIGITVATILINLFIDDIVEPYVLYKHVFKNKVKKYYLKNYFIMLVFIGLMFVLDLLMTNSHSHIVNLLINGSISVAISLVFTIIILLFKKDYREKIIEIIKHKKTKN